MQNHKKKNSRAIESWSVLESEKIIQLGLFGLRKDRCKLPDGRVMPGYYVLEFSDWVNVIPVTPEGNVVFVEQYRHGSQKNFLEIPGGSLDPASNEDPKQAALRELVEETGYVPEDIRLLQKHYPNPALQENSMWTFIAYGCRKLQEPKLDPFEDILVKEIPVGHLPQMLLDGQINHSIVMASLVLALPVLGIR